MCPVLLRLLLLESFNGSLRSLLSHAWYTLKVCDSLSWVVDLYGDSMGLECPYQLSDVHHHDDLRQEGVNGRAFISMA